MNNKEAKERFENFGTFCDDYNDACEGDCEKCFDMEDRILEALEKQIHKKPIEKDKGWLRWFCPNCNSQVGAVMERKYNYCEFCGQAIDWSEVE